MTDLLRARCIRSEQKLRAELTDEDVRLLAADRQKCHEYFLRQSWCASVEGAVTAYSVPRVVSVFLVTIAPRGDADAVLWSVVGDLPSAYLVVDDASEPAKVLELYIELMDDWITAIRNGDDLEDVFPVEASASPENATLLERRMHFLRSEMVPLAQAHWAELFPKSR